MGASMKDIKLRIKSVQNTMQTTKAMQLVAASKLRRARERIERTSAYFRLIHETLSDIASNEKGIRSDFMVPRTEINKICYLVIAGDRGLAGGYNSNVFKLLEAKMKQDGVPACVIPVGKRAVEFCKKRGMEILTEKYAIVEAITPADCAELAQFLAKEFMDGTFDQLQLVYTQFKSMLSQAPTVIQVLPIPTEEPAEKKEGPSAVTLYEPSPEEVFEAIVPEYISGTVYGAISQSWTSELAARRNAMDSATKNAGDMIDDLSLKYNRARQGAITQEITEIVAGAEH